MTSLKRNLLLGGVLALALVGAGFAQADEPVAKAEPAAVKLAVAPGSEEAALLARATRYWEHRVKREREVLDYYPPRELHPKGTMIPEGGGLVFMSFEIQDVQIDGDEGVVAVKTQAKMGGQTPFPIPDRVLDQNLRERWAKMDGLWLKQPVTPALRAVANELQRAFERRRAAEAEEPPPGAESPEIPPASEGPAPQ